MPDVNPVVRKAIEESVEEFVRGVRSHQPQNSDVTIPPTIIEWLQNHDDVIAAFEDQIGSDAGKWENDRLRVCRAAFHAGSLAAFHAYGSETKTINKDDIRKALGHIQYICEVRFGIRWVYCPWVPWPKTR